MNIVDSLCGHKSEEAGHAHTCNLMYGDFHTFSLLVKENYNK